MVAGNSRRGQRGKRNDFDQRCCKGNKDFTETEKSARQSSRLLFTRRRTTSTSLHPRTSLSLSLQAALLIPASAIRAHTSACRFGQDCWSRGQISIWDSGLTGSLQCKRCGWIETERWERERRRTREGLNAHTRNGNVARLCQGRSGRLKRLFYWKAAFAQGLLGCTLNPKSVL